MPPKVVRPAAKAGSWYSADVDELSDELLENLDGVPNTIDGNSLPVSGARVVISP